MIEGFDEVPRNHRPQAWIRRFRMRRAARNLARAKPPVTRRATPEPVAVAIAASKLAREHARLTQASAFDLADALTEHDRALAYAYAVARTATFENRRVEPAAEWLIDNVYLIRNAIRDVRDALPAATWRRLPRVETDHGSVVPRMLRVLRACVAQLDGNVEPKAVERYLADYQQHAPCDLIEIWTLPVLMR
ncbi:MAG: hypothetical protein ACREPJ_16810, partial [Rhodanobacteraceae bacterium]